ncbi:MAG: hypothetical protein ACOY6K_04140 [Pseudomonadota bacterium]
MAEHQDYERAAEALLKKMLEMHGRAISAQIDYGKWLISSLLLMHSSAIAGLIFKAGNNGAPPYLYATGWFVFGILLALASGFSAWWNFTFAARQYDHWSNPNMLIDRTKWPSYQLAPGIASTLWTSVVCGIGSVFCIPAGATHVMLVWH